MPAFRSLGTEQIQAVVRHLRSLQGRTAAEQLPGDPERGKGFFFGKAECSKCHMANGDGGSSARTFRAMPGTGGGRGAGRDHRAR